MHYYDDTVAAISTAYGKGGVALIRVSGPSALEICQKVFLPKSGKRVSELEGGRCVYGDIVKDGAVIDDGLLTVFLAPSSFTGEDVAELSCHGGILLTSRVLEALFDAGARQAEAGEFSKRAFLNGKTSLTESEAVIDRINAENDSQLRLSSNAAVRRLSAECAGIYNDLVALLASAYVYTDYPDEDLSDLSNEQLLQGLSAVRARLEGLLASYKAGRAVMEGIPTAILGKPNTGKSSLLNLLLKRERAIVSPVASTTRDTVEESALLGRVTLRLADTAGIHQTGDLVESIGIARSLEKLKEAELVFAVFDMSRPAEEEDEALIARLLEKDCPVIALLNKCDLEKSFDLALPERFLQIEMSCKQGLPPALEKTVARLFETERLGYSDCAVLTSARQAAAAKRAIALIDSAMEALEMGLTQDVAALDAELALAEIGEIDGRTVGEDIVSAIFSRFCVGK